MTDTGGGKINYVFNIFASVVTQDDGLYFPTMNAITSYIVHGLPESCHSPPRAVVFISLAGLGVSA